MDVLAAIRQLKEERARVDAMIAILESRLESERREDPEQGGSRRGRKKMSPEERIQVSERMRRYWAARRENVTS